MHSKNSPTPGSVPVAFVEFKDAACAASAMALLQGTFLLSSDRGAIRIEFAKSRMAAEMQLNMIKEVCTLFVIFFFKCDFNLLILYLLLYILYIWYLYAFYIYLYDNANTRSFCTAFFKTRNDYLFYPVS